jgi:hypothetical protein
VDIRRPPEAFDDLIVWFELVSYNLVLLEEYPLSDLRQAVNRVARAIELHGQSTERVLRVPPTAPSELQDLARVLTADHEWFRTSVEQLGWFFGVVERDDHGGHRQALGQYGRVLCESVRRHRAEEAEFARRAAHGGSREPIATRPRNTN